MMMLRLIYLNYIDTCVYLFDHVLVFSSSSLHCGKLSIQSKKSTGWGGRGGGREGAVLEGGKGGCAKGWN